MQLDFWMRLFPTARYIRRGQCVVNGFADVGLACASEPMVRITQPEVLITWK